MDIAVISDIHGNYIALKRCIEYSIGKNISTFIFLGDYTGEQAYPQRTMKILYELKGEYNCIFIRGNKEDYWINHRRNNNQEWKKGDSTTGSLLYTYSNLKKEDIDFFGTMPIVKEISFEGFPPLTVCHGSPNKVNEKLLPNDENTFSIMGETKTEFILCGHTHRQGEINHNDKKVLNAGSVGLSIQSGGKSQFLILHGENNVWNYEFVSLEYDVEKAISNLHKEELNNYAPYWCKITEHLLRTGETSHTQVLIRAMQICTEKNGNCVWPNIPENCWKQAVEEMLE